MYQERIERVLAALDNLGASQMLVTDPMSVYYLTGIFVQPFERFFGLLLRGDAVDKELPARFLLPLMEKNAASAFLNGSIAVDRTRGVKDKVEQEKMILSSQINDAAMARFKALIHEGVTELDVAAQMLDIYKALGADGYSFTPLVAFGANAADPHHEPDGTVLKAGDCVLFDVGCVRDGYCSDMTRTFFYREISEHSRQIYEIVRRANEAAEALVCPGVRLCELDAAARDLITAEGYGPQFNHRLGHFIGLKEHEFGDVSSAFDWPVEPGMIFSIEPGIYLAGDIGVRIEDLVLVTETGVQILNRYPHTLEIIGLDVVRILHHKTFAIPIELCISVMPPHVDMNRLMLAGEEHKNESK